MEEEPIIMALTFPAEQTQKSHATWPFTGVSVCSRSHKLTMVAAAVPGAP